MFRYPGLEFLVVLFLGQVVVTGQLVFIDGFEDGSAVDGNPVTWSVVPAWPLSTFYVVDGDLNLTAPAPFAAVIGVRDVTLGNTSIRAQVRLDGPGDETVAVFARGNETSNQAYGLEIDSLGDMWLGLAGQFERISTDLRPNVEDVMLQLDVIGSMITARAWRAGEPMPAAPLLTRQSNAITTGFPGVYYGAPNSLVGGTAIYRYVHVAAIPIHQACDFNSDSAVNVDDLNLLLQQGPVSPGIPLQPSSNGQFDLNGDGVIDNADVDQFLASAASLNGFGSAYKRGDANLDGIVDGQDFILWNNTKFTNSLLWNDGDFNGDGVVDGQDFILWNNSKFQSSDSVSAVPEPTMGIWFVVLMVASVSRLRHLTCQSSQKLVGRV